MTPRKTWPEVAEHCRMDGIALALDIMFLMRALQQANRHDNRVEVARLSQLAHQKAEGIQMHLQEAKRA